MGVLPNNRWKSKRLVVPTYVWSTLASLAIHSLFGALIWSSTQLSFSHNNKLQVKFRQPQHSNIAWTTNTAQTRDVTAISGYQPPSLESSASNTPENLAADEADDDVYLPQEVLASAATPAKEIDLQGESPPGPGLFRMMLWVDKNGVVTEVRVEDTETPLWFTERIVEIFKNSRFIPGTRNDRAVASTVSIEITFQ